MHLCDMKIKVFHQKKKTKKHIHLQKNFKKSEKRINLFIRKIPFNYKLNTKLKQNNLVNMHTFKY